MLLDKTVSHDFALGDGSRGGEGSHGDGIDGEEGVKLRTAAVRERMCVLRLGTPAVYDYVALLRSSAPRSWSRPLACERRRSSSCAGAQA